MDDMTSNHVIYGAAADSKAIWGCVTLGETEVSERNWQGY